MGSIKSFFNKFFIKPFSKAVSHIIYFTTIFTTIYCVSYLFLGADFTLLLQDYISTTLNQKSYLAKKIDNEIYAYSPSIGFDRDAMIKKTDNYVNKFDIDIVDREVADIKEYVSAENIRIYKLFYLDLKQYHYDLIFNKFDFDKDKALRGLYEIILKYKCTIEIANQELFNSKYPDELKQEFLSNRILGKIDDLIVESLLYTKSITINEFKKHKEKNNNTDKSKLWIDYIKNYHSIFANIIRGGLCYQNVFEPILDGKLAKPILKE